MDIAAIGVRIRSAREASGLTQAMLAERVGVTRSAIAQWETGRSGQVGGNLAHAAAALGVGVEYLLLGGAADRLDATVRSEKRQADAGLTGDELAMLRLYGECSAEDRQALLLLARRLSRIGQSAIGSRG